MRGLDWMLHRTYQVMFEQDLSWGEAVAATKQDWAMICKDPKVGDRFGIAGHSWEAGSLVAWQSVGKTRTRERAKLSSETLREMGKVKKITEDSLHRLYVVGRVCHVRRVCARVYV